MFAEHFSLSPTFLRMQKWALWFSVKAGINPDIECLSPALLLTVHVTLFQKKYERSQWKEKNYFLIPFKLFLQSQI